MEEKFRFAKFLSRRPESNWRPTDYKSVALPAELRRLYTHALKAQEWLKEDFILKKCQRTLLYPNLKRAKILKPATKQDKHLK